MAKKFSVNDPELVAFGKNLRALRKNRKLSQEKLALLARLDYSYVNEVENAKINPGLLSILALAEALQIAPGKLLDPALSPQLAEHSALPSLIESFKHLDLLPIYGRLIHDLLNQGQLETAKIWLELLETRHPEHWELSFRWGRYFAIKAFGLSTPANKQLADNSKVYILVQSEYVAHAWKALEAALDHPDPQNPTRSWLLQDSVLRHLQALDIRRWEALTGSSE